MKRLLIIEDDTALAEGIRLALQTDDYSICCCCKLSEARETLSEKTFDLLLLDINLPDGSGLDYCREVRQFSQVPIILLTAKGLETDVVTGFGAGADDYITKPFSLAILRARVEALLKRFDSLKPSRFQYFNAVFDFEGQRFEAGGTNLDFSKTEQKLLKKFLRNPGITLTREVLLEEIWRTDGEFVDANALSVVVKRVRDKLAEAKGLKIRTVYGIGYCLEVEKSYD